MTDASEHLRGGGGMEAREADTPWQEIVAVADGEEPEAVVFGTYGSAIWDEEDPDAVVPQEKQNKVLSGEEAREYLDRDDWTFFGGYGGVTTHYFFAWTERWVVALQVYDGSSRPVALPRNPMECAPQGIGGG